jgi:SAM-dependent methyltransferase
MREFALTPVALTQGVAAGAAFDRLASTYDQVFTESIIGRAQRNAVWKVLLKTFFRGDAILELNCGTGEDALLLGSHGISVFACDASSQMIARAEQRLSQHTPALPVVFCHLPTERIHEFDPAQRFDGVFSNFSGLNCMEDLTAVAATLSGSVKQGDALLLCFSTRICLTEIAYYALRGQWAKAFRRCKGHSTAIIEGAPLTVFYPTLRQIRRSFRPYFRLRAQRGIGVAIPPSYLETWARRHPHIMRLLCQIEPIVSLIPLLRSTGDHILLRFEKVTP